MQLFNNGRTHHYLLVDQFQLRFDLKDFGIAERVDK